MTRVHYLCTGFPGPKAGSVHIGKMTSAFAAIGSPTTIVRPYAVETRELDRRAFVSDAVRIRTLPAWPRSQREPRAHAATLFAGYGAYLAGAGAARKLDWLHVRDNRLAALAARTTPSRVRVGLEVHHSAVDAAAVKGVHLFVAISDGVAAGLRAAGVPDERLLVAHDAVDPTDYDNGDGATAALRAELGYGGRRIVGYTGHLYEDRGLETLVDAMAALPDDVLLHVVGGMPADVERVREHALRQGLGERVRLVGPVPPDQVAAHQALSDVLVCPYGNDYKMKAESSPLKLHEYMAVGRPVVVGDLPFARELVDDGSTGLYFEPDDPRSLADGISRALGGGPDVDAMVERARRLALSNTWENRARAILDRGAELPSARGR